MRAIITDIEGTTSPIAFVHSELFPYARAHLARFIEAHAAEPEVAACLAEAATLSPGRPVLETLLAWMDADAKVTPLKTLQGLIWNQGYAKGELIGRLYPDVPPALRSWHARGVRLYVYSSGSEAAQRLIFGHSDAGDLTPLFTGFFDTRIGPKRAPESYRAITRAIALPPAQCLFLSDTEEELDAASQAGLAVRHVVRPQDGTTPSLRHPTSSDFKCVSA
jgi:enolase-phosphatase E1